MSPLTVEVLEESRPYATIEDDILEGFDRTPKEIPAKYFYDARGIDLFNRITRLPEYYPTRRESAILEERAREIAERTGARELVEIGPGSARKAALLLGGFARENGLRRYLPLDISRAAVENVGEEILDAEPDLDVHGIVGCFHDDLRRLPRQGRRLIAFLGGTIGNLTDGEAASFLADVRSAMEPDDAFLMGADLGPGRVKTVEDIELAYNDEAGVTEAFNKNVLQVLDRQLGSSLQPEDFRHHAPWVEEESRIEMRLVAERPLDVSFEALDATWAMEAGEYLLTEISRKWDRPRVEAMLLDSDLQLEGWYTDEDEFFSLSLCRAA